MTGITDLLVPLIVKSEERAAFLEKIETIHWNILHALREMEMINNLPAHLGLVEFGKKWSLIVSLVDVCAIWLWKSVKCQQWDNFNIEYVNSVLQ